MKRKPMARKPIKRVIRRFKAGSISKLIKELDRVFSKFIRYSRAQNGIVECYTCGHKTEVKKIHAGHYISRWYKTTRWNENNVRPQFFMCNIYKKGDSVNFRERLIKEIGLEKVEHMEAESIKILKRGELKAENLQTQIDHYKQYLSTNNIK